MAGQGRKKSDLECPRCAVRGASKVIDTHLAANRRSRSRTYECEACWARFRTREAVESQELGQVVVRRASPGSKDRARWEPFRADAITEQLRTKLSKMLSQGERDAVVARVEQQLGQQLSELAAVIPARVARDRKWERNRVYVDGSAVRDQVEQALKWSGLDLDDTVVRDRHRAAHALFALATSGSTWDAAAVVTWLHDNYALARVGPRGLAATNTVAWHPPALDLPTLPKLVVKNFRPQRTRLDLPGDPDQALTGAQGISELADSRPDAETELATPLRRPTQPFEKAKLRDKIHAALQGRRHQEQITEGITQWVLWSLVGQTVVRSSQLSALVVDCLRRADSVGYLRWITVGKELSVEQIHEEAVNLLRYPGTRLHFRQDAAPTVVPQILPGGVETPN